MSESHGHISESFSRLTNKLHISKEKTEEKIPNEKKNDNNGKMDSISNQHFQKFNSKLGSIEKKEPILKHTS